MSAIRKVAFKLGRANAMRHPDVRKLQAECDELLRHAEESGYGAEAVDVEFEEEARGRKSLKGKK